MMAQSVRQVMAVFLGLLTFNTVPDARADTPSSTPFDGYETLCGYPIDVSRTAYLSQAHIDDSGTARITLDPELMQPRQGFHRMFLIAHECAHHKMKHTTRGGLAKRFGKLHGIRDQEMSADCWASETLTRLGMLPQVTNIADQFWRRGFVSPGGGYPSGIQRSNVIRHCARIAIEKMKAEVDASRRVRVWHPAER